MFTLPGAAAKRQCVDKDSDAVDSGHVSDGVVDGAHVGGHVDDGISECVDDRPQMDTTVHTIDLKHITAVSGTAVLAGDTSARATSADVNEDSSAQASAPIAGMQLHST
jgi:hypothetical protein